MRRSILAVPFILPLLLVAAIWYPVVVHYQVPRVRIDEGSFHRFLDEPSDLELKRLATLYLGDSESDPTGLPLDSPEERLRAAGMFNIDHELDRYDLAPDDARFEFIRRSVIEFCRRANRRTAYGEYLWNDHAIANRIFVLGRFWAHYRRHPSLDVREAREIVEHVVKSVQFLVKDDHYTYWTNHGIMQSIAVLHAANAFPGLPDQDRNVRAAMDRLSDQLKFYLSDSGWVMEHSAGYQVFGSNLMDTLLSELAMMGEGVPVDWQEKTRKSKQIVDRLIRPDGSMPNFGDSNLTALRRPVPRRPCGLIPPGADFWPDEGYLIAWDAGRSNGSDSCAQTTVLWPSFASRAHKRPNELSVHFWIDDVDYASSAGYWPYGDPDRPAAVGWRGSNAPHFSSEGDGDVYRVTEVRYCGTDQFRFLDLERINVTKALSVRRQVLDLGSQGLLLVDSGNSSGTMPLESVWRVDDRIRLIGPDGAIIREGTESPGLTHVMAISGDSASLHTLTAAYSNEGYSEPEKFAAIASHGRIRSAPSYIVIWDSSRPILVAMTPRTASDSHTVVRLTEFESPESWTIEGIQPTLTFERRESEIRKTDRSSGLSSQCHIVAGGTEGETAVMEAKYRELASRYPLFRPWIEYRLKATAAVAGLLAVQTLALALLWLAWLRKYQIWVVAAACLGWFVSGSYVLFEFLAE